MRLGVLHGRHDILLLVLADDPPVDECPQISALVQLHGLGRQLYFGERNIISDVVHLEDTC